MEQRSSGSEGTSCSWKCTFLLFNHLFLELLTDRTGLLVGLFAIIVVVRMPGAHGAAFR